MVGANYMGGKRNTARAKSKDVVGRAQRHHFGKQRLASALCVTQENRVHPIAPTLSSVLPEIRLAHARCDASADSGTTSSRKVFSGDRLYSSTLPSNTPRRNKPSKVLGALDISDHMSMRAAIDRILQQPNLIGINTPNRKDTAYTEHMQAPAAVRRPTDAHLDSKDQDTRSEIISKHVFDPKLSYSAIPRHELPDLPENNLKTRHGSTECGILSPPDSPSGICDVASRDASDYIGYAEPQLLAEADPFFYTEGDEPGWPNTFLGAVHPLPRSSPFPSSSQSSDNSILDLDTSPCAAIRAGRSDDLSEDVDCVYASSLRSTHQPIFRQPSRSFPIHEASTSVDEAQFTFSSFTDLNEDEPEAKRSQITCCNDGHAFPSTGNDFRHSSSSESGRDYIQVLTSQGVAEDGGPSDISIDFLSDPHPWETIDRILKLNPPDQSAVQSLKINFTKDREGVGYVSPERIGICNARSSDATSFEIRIDDEPTDHIRMASSADSPTLNSEALIVDNCMAVDTPDSPCANNPTRPLFCTGPPFTTRAEVDPCIHACALQEAPSIPVIHCTQEEHTQSSTPLVITGGTTAAEPDVDMTFDGPCLFGDSDLEEDE